MLHIIFESGHIHTTDYQILSVARLHRFPPPLSSLSLSLCVSQGIMLEVFANRQVQCFIQTWNTYNCHFTQVTRESVLCRFPPPHIYTLPCASQIQCFTKLEHTFNWNHTLVTLSYVSFSPSTPTCLSLSLFCASRHIHNRYNLHTYTHTPTQLTLLLTLGARNRFSASHLHTLHNLHRYNSTR